MLSRARPERQSRGLFPECGQHVRRHRLQAQLQCSLNNLGEALRVHGRLQEAVDAFEESEDPCRASGDAELAIVTALNRVLALEEMQAMPQAVCS